MKKILLAAFIVLFLGLAPHVFAQGFVPLAGIPGLTEGGAADSGNLAVFFNNLYKFLIGLAAALAVIEIIWGGLEISTESVSKKTEGKERIQNAIFGLVLVLSPVLVFSIINPSILNLSLNLEPLKLKVKAPIKETQVYASRCKITHSDQNLVTAECVSMSDVQSYSCPRGLTLRTPDCLLQDPNKGCQDSPVTASCVIERVAPGPAPSGPAPSGTGTWGYRVPPSTPNQY